MILSQFFRTPVPAFGGRKQRVVVGEVPVFGQDGYIVTNKPWSLKRMQSIRSLRPIKAFTSFALDPTLILHLKVEGNDFLSN
jgi:hypothetical protein